MESPPAARRPGAQGGGITAGLDVVLLLRKPSHAVLHQLMKASSSAAFSYPEVGATAADELPPGYRHQRHDRTLGEGRAAFDRAVEGLRTWRAHTGAGLEVTPPEAAPEPGTTVLVTTRLGWLRAVAPCRVVYAIDEGSRAGFAYGTLPGHPEQGEEAFVVELDPSGTVRFRITAFSRPGGLLVKLGDPVARLIQEWVTQRYLTGLERFVRQEP